jgi:uncharacterized protein (TIGR02145 family)
MKNLNFRFSILFFLCVFFSCNKNDEIVKDYPPVGSIKFYNNVIKLDNETNTSLIQIDSLSLSFKETNQILHVKVNDYLIGAPSTSCPTGFLRKVLSITKRNQLYTFTTQYASLEDVIEECNIVEVVPNIVYDDKAKKKFNVILFDRDGNTGTSNDQARIEGELDVDTKLIFELRRRPGGALQSTYMKAGLDFQVKKSLAFTCSASLFNFKHEMPLGPELRGPTFLIAGIIPLTPTLAFKAGMSGDIWVQMSIKASQTSNYKIYKEFVNGRFSDAKFENSAIKPLSLGLDFTGNASAKVYLKAECKLKVFEVIGIKVGSQMYLKGDASISFLDLTKINYCTKMGIDGYVGVEASVLNYTFFTSTITQPLYEAPLPEIFGIKPCGVITLRNPTQVVDRFNNVYNNISLNNRTWLTKNWKGLYNGVNTANNYDYGDFVNITQGNFLPQGWRVPTKTEYENLLISLGSNAFQILTNSSGFNARPYGYISVQSLASGNQNTHVDFNNKAIFISSTTSLSNTRDVEALVIDYNTRTVAIKTVPIDFNGTKGYYNVRLIKN